MSTARRASRKQPSKDQRDWLPIACVASVVLHCLAFILMPRPDTKNPEDLVVRALAFIQKDVLDPIRAPALPKITSQKTDNDNATKPDTVVPGKVLKIPETSVTVADREQITKSEKLKFVDRTTRRPGGKSDAPPRFQELVRSRISESCEKNVPNSIRMRGLTKIVVLAVTILPSGELESVNVVESSDLPEVDRASIAAVKLAAPFPSFPNNLGLSKLKLRVPIKFILSGNSG